MLLSNALVCIGLGGCTENSSQQDEPAILAAGLGFTDINEVPRLGNPGLSLLEAEALARQVGAGWHNVKALNRLIKLRYVHEQLQVRWLESLLYLGTLPLMGTDFLRIAALDDPMQVSYEP